MQAYKNKGEKYKVIWPEEPEFVRVAARFGATIIPVGAVGCEDRCAARHCQTRNISPSQLSQSRPPCWDCRTASNAGSRKTHMALAARHCSTCVIGMVTLCGTTCLLPHAYSVEMLLDAPEIRRLPFVGERIARQAAQIPQARRCIVFFICFAEQHDRRQWT